MKGISLFGAAIGLMLACSVSCAAQDSSQDRDSQDRGDWRAASSDAKAITGEILISETRLSINFAAFPIAEIRHLTPAETAAVFEADSNANPGGELYRLNVPATKQFLHHNTLCGSDETQWMVTYISGGQLQVAFFSGAKMPVFSFDAVSNSTNLCGTFTYVR